MQCPRTIEFYWVVGSSEGLRRQQQQQQQEQQQEPQPTLSPLPPPTKKKGPPHQHWGECPWPSSWTRLSHGPPWKTSAATHGLLVSNPAPNALKEKGSKAHDFLRNDARNFLKRFLMFFVPSKSVGYIYIHILQQIWGELHLGTSFRIRKYTIRCSLDVPRSLDLGVSKHLAIFWMIPIFLVMNVFSIP